MEFLNGLTGQDITMTLFFFVLMWKGFDFLNKWFEARKMNGGNMDYKEMKSLLQNITNVLVALTDMIKKHIEKTEQSQMKIESGADRIKEVSVEMKDQLRRIEDKVRNA